MKTELLYLHLLIVTEFLPKRLVEKEPHRPCIGMAKLPIFSTVNENPIQYGV